jgi:hypothetical protein
MTTDDHYAQAVSRSKEAAHDQAQQTPVSVRIPPQEGIKATKQQRENGFAKSTPCDKLRHNAGLSDKMALRTLSPSKVGDKGLEPPTSTV